MNNKHKFIISIDLIQQIHWVSNSAKKALTEYYLESFTNIIKFKAPTSILERLLKIVLFINFAVSIDFELINQIYPLATLFAKKHSEMFNRHSPPKSSIEKKSSFTLSSIDSCKHLNNESTNRNFSYI
jgi:hypothetical protein